VAGAGFEPATFGL